MKGAKLVFFITLFIALSLAGCVKDDDEPMFSLAVGDRVPAFTVAMDGGNTWTSTGAGGRGAVLVFFNTGCADCRRELPQVQEAYGESLCRGLAVDFVCIAREEGAESIREWWEAHGLSLPWSPQPDRAVYSLFATTGIPRIYVVSPAGIITAAFAPEDAPTAADLLAAVADVAM